jgi:hypothetical protein
MEENVETESKIQCNDETADIIASKMRQFAKGFKIPDDDIKKNKETKQ